MPIYEYQCRSCRRLFEKIVFREPRSVQCPECLEADAERLLSSFAVAVSGADPKPEAGPCHCGAPRRGMCREEG